jgi:multidrug efflux system membrane fusion protein
MDLRITLGACGLGLAAAVFGVRAWLGHDARPKDPPAPPAVHVVLGTVEKRDVPVWLDGLGTVAAWQQVTVRSQVDGRLDSVAFREGQTVEKGQPLAQIDPRPFQVQLHQAEGNLARDQATVKNGKLNLARYQALVEQKLIAPQQADDQAAVVAQSEGALQADQAAIEAARLNLDYATVRAPFAGVVGVRLVDPGNQVRAADATGLVVLTQVEPVAVLITLPQDQLDAVVAALRAGEVQVQLWSRDGTRPLGTGTVYAIDNQIAVATGTVKVKARAENPDHHLWPNQFVKARLLVDTDRGALVVPAAAIQRGPQGTFVYIVAADQTAAPKPVTVARVTGDQAVVTGVAAGAQVVVEGQGQLRPGAKVTAGKP